MYSEMMSKNTKALFYDIDGTLLSEKTGRVPDAAREALREARRRGHSKATASDVVLEPYAAFETKTVEEDGIAYAMTALGLV